MLKNVKCARCVKCGKEYEAVPNLTNCSCGGILDIMHESGLTFLGFGMPPEQPAIGIILSESMRYISSGAWWLVFFPGLALVLIVILIEALGTTVRLLFEPRQAQL